MYKRIMKTIIIILLTLFCSDIFGDINKNFLESNLMKLFSIITNTSINDIDTISNISNYILNLYEINGFINNNIDNTNILDDIMYITAFYSGFLKDINKDFTSNSLYTNRLNLITNNILLSKLFFIFDILDKSTNIIKYIDYFNLENTVIELQNQYPDSKYISSLSIFCYDLYNRFNLYSINNNYNTLSSISIVSNIIDDYSDNMEMKLKIVNTNSIYITKINPKNQFFLIEGLTKSSTISYNRLYEINILPGATETEYIYFDKSLKFQYKLIYTDYYSSKKTLKTIYFYDLNNVHTFNDLKINR